MYIFNDDVMEDFMQLVSDLRRAEFMTGVNSPGLTDCMLTNYEDYRKIVDDSFKKLYNLYLDAYINNESEDI